MGDPRNSHTYRQARARFIALADPHCAWPDCPVPDRLVDKRLSGRSRWGPTVDHTIPFAVDPAAFWNIANWRLLHNRCNVSKGLRTDTAVMPAANSGATASGGDSGPGATDVAARFGFTAAELQAWSDRGLFPGASLQWFEPFEYAGLPVPRPAPSWWPPR